MTLGQEFRELVEELLTEDDGFGSALRWRHYDRVEDPATGEVTTTVDSEVSFRGGIAQPLALKPFLSEANLLQATCAVVVPAGQLVTEPKQNDEVEVATGEWLRVLEFQKVLGPGDAGSPVLIAYVAALVS